MPVTSFVIEKKTHIAVKCTLRSPRSANTQPPLTSSKPVKPPLNQQSVRQKDFQNSLAL